MVNPDSSIPDFSKDMLARYVCNGLDEASASAVRPGGFRNHRHIITSSNIAGSQRHQQPVVWWHTTACCHFDSRRPVTYRRRPISQARPGGETDGHHH
jgi:hypothetical protein